MKRCDVPQPERIPLPLNTLGDEVSLEFGQAINQLKLAASENLFLWKEFSVELPESIVSVSNLPVRSFFSVPDFNECELLSKDVFGNLKPLNGLQLAQLRRHAEFNVASSNFIGEVHTWKLSPLFLKGTLNVRKTFKKDLYRSLAQLVVHARDRIVGDHFSIRSSFLALFRDFMLMFIDLLFGLPCVNHGDVDQKLLEERLRFLTCELSVKSTDRKRVIDFWDTYEQLMCLPRGSFEPRPELPNPPYRFITPSRIPIDLRLHDLDLLDSCLAVIGELRQVARIGWFQDLKEQAISHYIDEGRSLVEIKRLVRRQGLHEYASRLFDLMRRSSALHSICDGIAEPLIQQATFNLIVAEAKEAFADALSAYEESADRELKQSHPILYHITEWRSRRMAHLRERYLEAHKLDVHEFVLSKCAEAGFDQYVFFISRDLTFLRDREHLLRDQLKKSTIFPDTEFIFRVPAQLLRHWRVYRKTGFPKSNSEIVDTVLIKCQPPASNHPASVQLVTKRGVPHEPFRRTSFQCRPPRIDQELGPEDFDVHNGGPSHNFRPSDTLLSHKSPTNGNSRVTSRPHLINDGLKEHHCSSELIVDSNLTYKTSTRWFMWRWSVFFICTYVWLLRLGQLFLITVPFRSAFSLTAIFKPSPIYLKLELDHSSGYLLYDKHCYQDTLISRIRRIWREIRASRHAFDISPSEGILDKTAARPLHRIWSYVFRGFLGSSLLVIFWPPLCIIVSTVSLILGFLLPVAIPVVSLILHLLGIVFWDAYKPITKCNRLLPLTELVVGHLLIRFLLQLILSTLIAFVFCPTWAIVLLVWAFVRSAARSIWDSVVFYVVLRIWARIPSRDDFMVKRIAGPGTADNHFYRARPVDILVILVCQLELLELHIWRCQLEALAEKPMDTYRQLVKGLSWLSLAPKTDGELFVTLNRSCKRWKAEIQAKTDDRSQALQIHLKSDQLQRIKLSDRDLHHTVRMGTELTESFFQTRIAPRLQKVNHDRTAWWSEFGLNADDHLGLCTTLLGRIFGEQIFTCIKETDTVFPLQVRESSLTRHFQKYMIDLVGGWRSMGALDSVGSPQLRGSNATEINNEDVLSLASDDAAASSSGLISQRCTVIAASPSNHIVMSSGRLEPESSLSVSVEKGLSFAFPDTLRINQHRALPDPIAFIHVGLPSLPMSLFAPLTYRDLPSPLRPSPNMPTLNNIPLLECTRLEGLFHCCICPTSTMSGHQAPMDLKSKVATSCDVSGIPPHQCGLTTLLIEEEEEKELIQQLFGWSQRAVRNETVQDFSAWNSLHLSEEPLSVHTTLVHNETSVGKSFQCFFRHLFSCSSCKPVRQPSVVTLIRHLGRVYHPAVITLLMHSRDREQSPLDLSHPIIQAAVLNITTPHKQLGILKRLRSHMYSKEAPPYSSSSRSQLVPSVESGLASDQFAQRGSQSGVVSSHRSGPKERFCRSVAAFNHSSAALNVRSPLDLLPRRGRSVIEVSGSFNRRRIDGTPSPRTGAFHRQSAISECGWEDGKANPLTSGCEVDQHELQVWISQKPTTECCWTEFGPLTYAANGQDGSGGTPSGSLYATEDAATTDDLETEDTISISSENPRDFMQSMFRGSKALAFLPESTDYSARTSLIVREQLVSTAYGSDIVRTKPLSSASISPHVPPSSSTVASVFSDISQHRRYASSSPVRGHLSTKCTVVQSDPQLLQCLVVSIASQSQPDLVKDVSRYTDAFPPSVHTNTQTVMENMVSGVSTVSKDDSFYISIAKEEGGVHEASQPLMLS